LAPRGWDNCSTNSTAVSDAMTDYVFRWERTQYTNARGETVRNWKVLQQLHGMVLDLESEGIEVLFWWVPREYNQEADALAYNVLY
jgi:ribonuclease HI